MDLDNPREVGEIRHSLFEIGVVLKAVNGIFEIVLALLVLFIHQIAHFAGFLIHGDFLEDSSDIIGNLIKKLFPVIHPHTFIFVAAYLFSHGIIKIFLAISLLKEKLWAYPTSAFIFMIFVGYELYRYTITSSLLLLMFTLFDIILVVLIWREYIFALRKRNLTSN